MRRWAPTRSARTRASRRWWLPPWRRTRWARRRGIFPCSRVQPRRHGRRLHVRLRKLIRCTNGRKRGTTTSWRRPPTRRTARRKPWCAHRWRDPSRWTPSRQRPVHNRGQLWTGLLDLGLAQTARTRHPTDGLANLCQHQAMAITNGVRRCGSLRSVGQLSGNVDLYGV